MDITWHPSPVLDNDAAFSLCKNPTSFEKGKVLRVLRCYFACLIWDFRKFHL